MAPPDWWCDFGWGLAKCAGCRRIVANRGCSACKVRLCGNLCSLQHACPGSARLSAKNVRAQTRIVLRVCYSATAAADADQYECFESIVEEDLTFQSIVEREEDLTFQSIIGESVCGESVAAVEGPSPEVASEVVAKEVEVVHVGAKDARDQISIDLARTFHGHPLVSEQLPRIDAMLRRLSIDDAELGYVQGMSLVAAAFAVAEEDSPRAYTRFFGFVGKVRGLWLNGFPLYEQGRKSFASIACDKPWFSHLDSHMVDSMYLPQAWLGFFAKWVPFETLVDCLVIFEEHGFLGMLAMTFAVLEHVSDELCSQNDIDSLKHVFDNLQSKAPPSEQLQNAVLEWVSVVRSWESLSPSAKQVPDASLTPTRARWVQDSYTALMRSLYEELILPETVISQEPLASEHSQAAVLTTGAVADGQPIVSAASASHLDEKMSPAPAPVSSRSWNWLWALRGPRTRGPRALVSTQVSDPSSPVCDASAPSDEAATPATAAYPLALVEDPAGSKDTSNIIDAVYREHKLSLNALGAATRASIFAYHASIFWEKHPFAQLAKDLSSLMLQPPELLHIKLEESANVADPSRRSVTTKACDALALREKLQLHVSVPFGPSRLLEKSVLSALLQQWSGTHTKDVQ